MRVSFNPRTPFKFLFATTTREGYLERYVLREHKKGRPFAAILDDPYVRAWSTAEERARLLERPNLLAAIGEDAIAHLRAAVADATRQAASSGSKPARATTMPMPRRRGRAERHSPTGGSP